MMWTNLIGSGPHEPTEEQTFSDILEDILEEQALHCDEAIHTRGRTILTVIISQTEGEEEALISITNLANSRSVQMRSAHVEIEGKKIPTELRMMQLHYCNTFDEVAWKASDDAGDVQMTFYDCGTAAVRVDIFRATYAPGSLLEALL